MTERTIHIAQGCTAAEAAAMVAAIRAFEGSDARSVGPAPPVVKTAAGSLSGSAQPSRKEGGGILWTRTEQSLRRGL